MKYRITIRNQFKALSFIIFIFIFCLGCIFYLNYTQGDKSHALGFFSIFFIISLLPVLYLHIEYYYFNSGTSLIIVPPENKLIYTNKSGEVKSIYFSDLSKIVLQMDPTWHRKSSFRTLPFGVYHFAKIFLKSGEEIIITSLMATKVEEALSSIKGVPIEKKVNFYPSILLQKKMEKAF